MRSPSRRSDSHLGAVARTLASPLAFEEDGAWALAAETEATEAIGADQALFHWPDSGRFFSGTISEDEIRTYNAFRPLMRSIGYVERAARLGVATRRDAYGPHYEAMQATVYTNEYLPVVRGYDSLVLTMPEGPAQPGPSDPEPTQLLLHMSTPERAFEAEHVGVAQRLFPAFTAGISIHRQLAKAREDLYALVDSSGGACAIYSLDRRRLHVSRSLEQTLAREPHRQALSDCMHGLVRDALASPARAGIAHIDGVRGRYRLAASEARALRPLLIVTVDAPPEPARRPATAAVADCHGLTPRQAEVALLLAERRTNREIASALCISVHTARHHVEAVLAHLGVNRRGVQETIERCIARDSNQPDG